MDESFILELIFKCSSEHYHLCPFDERQILVIKNIMTEVYNKALSDADSALVWVE